MENDSFRRELDNLKRVHGMHSHIISLLASWTQGGYGALLLPYADCDLDEYWRQESHKTIWDVEKEAIDLETVSWMSNQILGLTEALATIHSPHRQSSTWKYGRYGDVKPKNILWFPSTSQGRGRLVLTDFGSATFHADDIEEGEVAAHVAVSPTYRPPEFDIRDGMASRASDIWSFGCLLLEFVCWALGGEQLLNDFEESRLSPYITGVTSSSFFDVKIRTDGKHLIYVKSEVSQVCTSLLHENHKCLLLVVHTTAA